MRIIKTEMKTLEMQRIFKIKMQKIKMLKIQKIKILKTEKKMEMR